MSERRTPWVLYALIAVNAAMFVAEVASGASAVKPTPQQIIDLGGNFALLTLRGEWWRLGSSMFLHFGILHVALNMLCLWQARAVEPAFGRLAFLVIYLLAGLAGGLAALVATPGGAIAGASGSVFGVYGALGVQLVMRRAEFDPEVWLKTTRRLATFLGLNLVVGLTTPGISLAAHIAGFVVGAAAGVVLLAGANAEQQRIRRSLAIAALGIALTAGALLMMKPAPAYAVLDHFDALEKTALRTSNETLRRLTAGEISEAEYLTVLARDVVAPYRQLSEELHAAGDPPEGLRPLLDRIDAVITARLAMWDVRKAAGAAKDPAEHAARIEDYNRAVARSNELVHELTAEYQRLSGK